MDPHERFFRFFEQFHFQKDMEGYIGIEREFFLADDQGNIAPESPRFLARIHDPAWTYELSACQVEHRTQPARDNSEILRNLLKGTNDGKRTAQDMKCLFLAKEVAPEDMPFITYPDPRYEDMVERLGIERLRAACRVAGIHVHIGVRDIFHAIRIYNALLSHLDALIALGDHSDGLRIALYKIVAHDWKPKKLDNPADFFHLARAHGFVHDPRNSHQLIRISPHGTVECRMFDMTEHADEILMYVDTVKQIARRA